MCIECKYGHSCPYVEGTSDLFHAMLQSGHIDENLWSQKQEVVGKMKELIMREFDVTCEFDLDVDITECEGFESGS